MKTTSITQLVSCTFVIALAVTGCGSAREGDTNSSTTAGSAGASGGVPASSAGAAGSQNQSGTSGATVTGGAPATAGSASAAGAGASGAAGAAQAGGGAGGAGGAITSTPDEGPCTDNSLQSGNATVPIQYAGKDREYRIHVPMSYTGTTRVPLLIDMHGSGQSADAQKGTSGWDRKADTTGFIVVYPTALNARWNAGTCCSPSVEQNVDDVGFLRAVVEKVRQDGCVDRKRVYASGLSGGGLMSYRLACEAADVFAAVAPVSGATVFSPCQPSAPVSVIAYRGLNDDLVPYNGGMPLMWYFQGAKADFDQWSMLDQCTGPVTKSHGICETKTQCAGGSDVTLCSVDSGHIPYGDAANASAAVPDVAWEIFQRHALP